MKKMFGTLCATMLLLVCAWGCGQKKEEKTVEVKVMSYNLRMATDEDGDNRWSMRLPQISEMLKIEEPAILGVQEAFKGMIDDLLKMLPNYKYIGVGREDGVEKGEYSAIIYDTQRFDIGDNGYFWLCEDPTKPAKGWDAACERIATWAILTDKINGKEFFFLNTHFDHEGKLARRNSTQMILDAVKEKNPKHLPVVVTGDFNSDPNNEVIEMLTTVEGHLIDSRTIAKKVDGPEATFHDFGRIEVGERPRIDYIFVNDQVTVSYYKCVEYGLDNGRYVSDHCPIIAYLSF